MTPTLKCFSLCKSIWRPLKEGQGCQKKKQSGRLSGNEQRSINDHKNCRWICINSTTFWKARNTIYALCLSALQRCGHHLLVPRTCILPLISSYMQKRNMKWQLWGRKGRTKSKDLNIQVEKKERLFLANENTNKHSTEKNAAEGQKIEAEERQNKRFFFVVYFRYFSFVKI